METATILVVRIVDGRPNWAGPFTLDEAHSFAQAAQGHSALTFMKIPNEVLWLMNLNSVMAQLPPAFQNELKATIKAMAEVATKMAAINEGNEADLMIGPSVQNE